MAPIRAAAAPARGPPSARARGRGREEGPEAEGEEGHCGGECGRRFTDQGDGDGSGAPGRHEREPAPQQALRAHAGHGAVGEHGAGDVAGDDGRLVIAEFLGGDAQSLDEDEGAGGDEGEEAAEDQPARDGVAEEAARGHQGAVVVEERPRADGHARRRRQGLGQAAPHGQGDGGDEGREDEEVGAPAEVHVHVAPQERAHGGGDGDDHAIDGEEADGGRLVIEVSDDGEGDDRLDAGRHPLGGAGTDQDPDAPGKAAGEGREREGRHADEHHRAPAARIAERAEDELGQGEAGDVEGHGELDHRRIGREDG